MRATSRVRMCVFSTLLLVSIVVGHAFAATGYAGGKPWQIGDVIVCFGSGTCNVLRVSGSTLTLLDQFSDGIGGNTNGIAINNTLHLLLTDGAASHSGSTSNVIEYTIASLDPLQLTPTTVTHAPATSAPFSDSGANAQAIVVNSAGQLFVGNAGNGSNPPSIAQLNPDGTLATSSSIPPLVLPSNPLPLTGSFTSCVDTPSPTLLSMDLSADGTAMYITSAGGGIQKLSLATTTTACTPFANFGYRVHLYGMKDIPANALPANCGSSSCPTRESILVVANGFTDPDAVTGENEGADEDAINICTNQNGTTVNSCVLLLDTAGAGLAAPSWLANNLYSNTNTTILDPHSHVQQVSTPGTSGADEPAFGPASLTVDNAVKWTDLGPQNLWVANHAYPAGAPPGPSVAAVAGTYLVDQNGLLQTVTTAGTSGPNQPTFASSGTTIDGLVWTDQGPITPWAAATSFSVGTLSVDAQGFVQKVTTAGASTTPSQPVWTETAGGTTTDGLIWADQGRSAVAWQPNTSYAAGAVIEDDAGHLQTATNAGTSGASVTFNDSGSTTTDNDITWQDQGLAAPVWQANTAYSLNATIEDSSGNLQKAVSGGVSGAASAPAFNHGPNATTTDNVVIWTNQGGPAQAWTAGHPYTLGTLITESQYVQLVTEAGTSGTNTPNFTHTTGGATNDNAVIWSESQPARAATQAYVLNAIVVDTFSPPHVQMVTLAGTTGPNSITFNDNGATVVDGLQWSDQPNPSILARYPVANTDSLRSLALDPLVADCTGTNCSSTMKPRMVYNFWVGDSQSASIYRVDFATGAGGSPTALNGSPACNTPCTTFSSIQAIGIYGGETANQPGLAKLLTGSSLNSGNKFTASVTFPPGGSADLNTWTLTAYGTNSSLTGTIPLTLYGSLIPYAASAAKGGNNSGVSDTGSVTSTANGYQVIGSTPCEPTTTDPRNCLIWKADLALPANSYLSEAVTSPTGVDFGTDLFVDLHYDITTSVGPADPVGKTYSSVHSVHEITSSVPPGQSGCVFVSPVQNQCYKTNRNTLNFTFQCPGLTQQQFLSLANAPGPPLLSLVRKFPNQTPKPAPQVIQLSTTNNKAPFRYSSSANAYTFQWNVTNALNSNQIAKTGSTNLRGCTFDPTGTVQTFCVDFSMNPSCKQ